MIRRLLLLLFLLFAVSSVTFGSWKQMIRFNRQPSCAYFFGANTGFVGFGSLMLQTQSIAEIQRTTDGGVTWSACRIPSTVGKVSAIFMQSKTVGYASVMFGTYSLWKTTDGGQNWVGVTRSGQQEGSTCVYATPYALTTTSWSVIGGSSLDDGKTFSQVFFSQDNQDRSNGIDFVDDKNGVVTMGPDGSGWSTWDSYTYYTNDGGITWKRGGMLKESWGVYADKASMTYFSMAEDNQSSPGNTLYWSQDGGKSWKPRYTFPNLAFTGHIAGVGKTIYVQTAISKNQGLYRSDDDGASWRAVLGPSNDRDTRFFVTGCRGEVVYAFDNNGGIWRTTDGGDGTLIPAPYVGEIDPAAPGSTTIIPIRYDSLALATTVPEISGSILLNDDLLTPDSLEFSRSQFKDSVVFDTIYQSQPGVWSFDIRFKPTTKLTGSSTLPMFEVIARAYLTDTVSTSVDLGPLSIINGPTVTQLSNCPTVQGSVNGTFTLITRCGDTTLMEYLRGVSVRSFFSAYPNPADRSLTLRGNLPTAATFTATFVSADGGTSASETLERASGRFEQALRTDELPAGPYLLEIRTSVGDVHTLKVIIRH